MEAATILVPFQAAVAAHGGRTALADEAAACTFEALDRWSNGIALRAARCAGSPGERVCILTERSYAAAAAFIGLAKAGLVSLRVNTGHPASYLRSILDDAGARLIVTTREERALARSLQRADESVIDLEDCPAAADGPSWTPRPDDRLCIAYTSGSTGRPKGVVHTHRSIMSFAAGYISRTELQPEDRVAMLHDSRGLDMLAALITGAACCFFPVHRQGFSGFADWLVENRITILPTVPTVFRSMLKAFDGESGALSVRLIRLSGELPAAPDLRQSRRVFPPGCRVLNWFGSTEVAVASCSLSFDDLEDLSTIPAGDVLPGLEIDIDAGASGSVAAGRRGEITVTGDALFEGYWGRPELTRQKFCVVPGRPGCRRFHTGDLGYLDSDCRLVVIGRADRQLKFNGYRIEPLEIEAVLRTVPAIEDAAVDLVETRDGRTALAAYVVTPGDGQPRIDGIRRAIAAKLPGYMIPGYFTRIDEIPRLAGGKPDLRALPAVVPLTSRDYNPNRAVARHHPPDNDEA